MSRCPKQEFRDRAVAAFGTYEQTLQGTLRNLAGASSQALYDAQILSAPLAEMAIACRDYALLDRLASAILPAASAAADGLDALTGQTERQWRVNGVESRLNSAQFLHLVGRTLNAFLSRPVHERTDVERQFVGAYGRLLASSVAFWVFRAPWYGYTGCSNPNSANTVGHITLVRGMRDRSFGTELSFCNSPSDLDLFVIADAAELLRSATLDPSLQLLQNAGIDGVALMLYVTTSVELLRRLVVPTTVTDDAGGVRQGYDFDPQGWRDWREDHGFSGFSGTAFPTPAELSTDPNASWDLSHARRFVSLFDSTRDLAVATGRKWPSDAEMRGFADQLVFAVAVDRAGLPRFKNYFSGVNGWYRVNYSGQVGFGYGPFDAGSPAFLSGGFAAWGVFSPELAAMTARLETALRATDRPTIDARNQAYGSIWFNGTRTSNLDVSASSRLMMSFYASAVTPPPPKPVTTKPPTTNQPAAPAATKATTTQVLYRLTDGSTRPLAGSMLRAPVTLVVEPASGTTGEVRIFLNGRETQRRKTRPFTFLLPPTPTCGAQRLLISFRDGPSTKTTRVTFQFACD